MHCKMYNIRILGRFLYYMQLNLYRSAAVRAQCCLVLWEISSLSISSSVVVLLGVGWEV